MVAVEEKGVDPIGKRREKKGDFGGEGKQERDEITLKKNSPLQEDLLLILSLTTSSSSFLSTNADSTNFSTP